MKQNQLRSLFLFLVDNLIWVFVAVSLVTFSLLSKRFFSPYNLLNLLARVAPLGLLVIGQAFTLITANFDLSSESTMGLTAMLAGLLLASTANGGLGLMWSPAVAIMLMLVVGVLIGLLNGLLITRMRMNNFIVTVAMMMVLRGATYAISPGKSISPFPEAFAWLGGGALFRLPAAGGKFIAVPVATVFLILAFLVAFLVTRYRRFGRNMYAVGASRAAAETAGINSGRIIIAVYMISGFCAAMAGWLDGGRLNAATPQTGSGLIFPLTAAAVIGGISLFGGRGNMIGAFGGVFLWGILDTGLNIMQVSPYWIEVARGGLVLFAMFIDALKVGYLRRVAIEKVLAKTAIGLRDLSPVA
jgi:ribose/xylose/arabinose/galactoside ABC-type transport system permease subunit